MLEGIRDSDPRGGEGPHIGIGQCQLGCAPCGSDSTRGDAAPYLPYLGGRVAGHPRLGRFPKSGRDEARLVVLGPPFIPSLGPAGASFHSGDPSVEE